MKNFFTQREMNCGSCGCEIPEGAPIHYNENEIICEECYRDNIYEECDDDSDACLFR